MTSSTTIVHSEEDESLPTGYFSFSSIVKGRRVESIIFTVPYSQAQEVFAVTTQMPLGLNDADLVEVKLVKSL